MTNASARLIAAFALSAVSALAGCSGRPAATPPAAAASQTPAAPAAAAPAPAMAVGHGGGQAPAASAPPAPVTTPVEPARNGTTIAALWKTRAGLAGKTVTVRGKVMKFNGGILGVNWIHLQDGTGKAADGSNDITVTSDMTAAVGDVVTVTGVVAVNKNLGSGYSYPVIIERANIVGR